MKRETNTVGRATGSPRVEGAGQLLSLLRWTSPMTVSELAAGLGASRSTVMLRLEALMTASLVATQLPTHGARGRPATVYRFDPHGGVLLAAHLGMTGCRLAVTDLAGELLDDRYLEVDLLDGPGQLLTDLAAGFDGMLAQLSLPDRAVVGIGLAMPSGAELLSHARALGVTGAAWDRAQIDREISERYSAPTFVDLDVNMLALAERRTSWPDVEVFVCVKLGTLIDAAIVVNDAPVRGVGNAAGSLGHIKVVGSTEPCTCGGVGCLDAVASGGALVRQMARAGLDVSHVSEVIHLVGEGHPQAVLAVREAGKRIGEALSSIVNLLNPSVISTWGFLTGAESVLFAGIREGMYQAALPRASDQLHLVVTALGETAGVRGAAMRVIDEILDPAAVDRALELGTFPTRAHAPQSLGGSFLARDD